MFTSGVPYLERCAFVLGRQNDGKSSQIRDIYRDVRLGDGKTRIGQAGRMQDWIQISEHRHLLVRLTSPHEYGLDPQGYFDGIDQKVGLDTKYRWNYLSALQIDAFRNMPHPEIAIDAFQARFSPEKVRLFILCKSFGGLQQSQASLDRILKHKFASNVEIVQIDGQRDNGLVIADFFEFQ